MAALLPPGQTSLLRPGMIARGGHLVLCNYWGVVVARKSPGGTPFLRSDGFGAGGRGGIPGLVYMYY